MQGGPLRYALANLDNRAQRRTYVDHAWCKQPVVKALRNHGATGSACSWLSRVFRTYVPALLSPTLTLLLGHPSASGASEQELTALAASVTRSKARHQRLRKPDMPRGQAGGTLEPPTRRLDVNHTGLRQAAHQAHG